MYNKNISLSLFFFRSTFVYPIPIYTVPYFSCYVSGTRENKRKNIQLPRLFNSFSETLFQITLLPDGPLVPTRASRVKFINYRVPITI